MKTSSRRKIRSQINTWNTKCHISLVFSTFLPLPVLINYNTLHPLFLHCFKCTSLTFSLNNLIKIWLKFELHSDVKLLNFTSLTVLYIIHIFAYFDGLYFIKIFFSCYYCSLKLCQPKWGYMTSWGTFYHIQKSTPWTLIVKRISKLCVHRCSLWWMQQQQQKTVINQPTAATSSHLTWQEERWMDYTFPPNRCLQSEGSLGGGGGEGYLVGKVKGEKRLERVGEQQVAGVNLTH